ncbi:MAG: hypothetical protein B7Z37_14165 [Verrucomicrobia bacterium 12-59-8]|nr:MAG: hypothetical protein B7Z37_14165 [Verrucomicrobia bacterium 12-59-8]
MTDGPQLFGSLALASHRNGSPIKLPRAQDEVVMLAFEQRNCRLVELHIFTGKAAAEPASGQPASTRQLVRPVNRQSQRKWNASRLGGRKSKPGKRRQVRSARVRAWCRHRFYESKATLPQAEVKPEFSDEGVQLRTCELLRGAAGARGHSFMTILEVGVDDGLAYYVTNLNEGEFVQDYVQRRGAVPTVTSLALMHQLLQDLGRAEEQGQLPANVRLDRVLVSSQEEEYLQLRLFDYGLSQSSSATSGPSSSRLVTEACRLLFLLMTGQAYPGGNPEDFGVIAELPASLRFVLKSVLTCTADHSVSSKTLRDEVREAMCSHVTLVQARNPKLLLVAEPATLPISHLQALLLGDIPLKTLFGVSFSIQNPELSGCHPFAISAVNVADEQQVTLQLLPPEREVREPGMSLSALMAKRGTLNPGEVITLLRQIQAGLDQAVETGVLRVDLDPANIQLCVGYDGPVLPRDLERLHQKRLDAWPKFVVKLRLHKTMRTLCKPRLIDLSPWENHPSEELTGIAAREARHRSFICLAAYLLTGEGQMREIAEFPTSMPEQVIGYVQDCLQRVLSGSALPTPPDFTEKLSYLLTAASAELDSVEDPLAVQAPIALHEMASAGFISDFEEDWTPEEAPVDHAKKTLILAPVSSDLQSFDFHRPSPPRFSFPWLALAATVLLLGTVSWMIFGDLPSAGSVTFASFTSSPPPEAAPVQEVVESTPKHAAIPPSQTLPQPIIHKIPVVAVELPTPAPAPSPAPVAEVAVVPPQAEALTSPMPATPTPQAPASSMLASVTPQEKLPAKEMAVTSQPPLPLVASENTAASVTAPAEEPVIRRAILTPAQNDKLTSGDLAPKEMTTNLPTPPAAPVVAAAEPPSSPPSPAAAPSEVAALQEVTIRHAIVLTPEEINETLRAQTQARKRTSRRR